MSDAAGPHAVDLCVGIDYSGADTPQTPLSGLRAYACTPGGEPAALTPEGVPPGRSAHWTREGLAHRLLQYLSGGSRLLVGIDHGFSFPESYFERYQLETWDQFLGDFSEHWPTHLPGCTVESLRDGRWWKTHPQPPRARIGDSSEWRLCERWSSSAKSVFHFDAQGSVAKSTHAGLPWLRFLRQQAGPALHLWPFDGWEIPPQASMICEVYPSIFRNRYPRQERSPDQQDAYAVARWLGEICQRGALERYLSPPLSVAERQVAGREGWILGIG